eukprot:TRINITY_DN4197_c0_g1_i1.p1 TRINITY_DN4197_c0_g1~~TRINITY_DN4197_c0_g1_i1.p1  ORF type:complete len:514 (-),score=95.43 TRINITY_DN4197_c0_g1_i1:859-2379(-)
MATQTIQIFGRIRPTQSAPGLHSVENGKISFELPKTEVAGVSNHARSLFDFQFNHIFDMDAKQEQVFAMVAKPVIMNVLEGYNGTIFAYGQTGSGKSFTITGGEDHRDQRGIIPRTLEFLFAEYKRRSDSQFTTYVSYLEIYNEKGFDLFDVGDDMKSIEELRRVHLLENSEGQIICKDLSTHLVTQEDEALELLFIGDTNRTIAENPYNPVSSRSHCIFTIMIESRSNNTDLVKRSKLHIVDLAGSERVAKSGVDGQLLKEAKYINKSLHFLEQVIVALQERTSHSHVPYRNSMMTNILRDSLGGNCKTTMIATISVQADHLLESISTCRFAQRVACIANVATVNEDLDPNLKIKRLQKEVAELKAEIALLKGDSATGPVTAEERAKVKEAVAAYIDDASDQRIQLLSDMRLIREAYALFRQFVLERPKDGSAGAANVDVIELNKLRSSLHSREQEISTQKKITTSGGNLFCFFFVVVGLMMWSDDIVYLTLVFFSFPQRCLLKW